MPADVRILFDTHVLLWAAAGSPRLPQSARRLLNDPHTEPWFSAVSIWEVVIKAGLGRDDFAVDASLLRRGLLTHGYSELPITGRHALQVSELPPMHADPFDRMLLAQARSEGMQLASADAQLAGLPQVLSLA